MNYHWFIILVLACTIFIIVRSAPDWGPLPYEYFHEFYDHYAEHMQHMQHVHEAHHENQHRVHETYHENFYDVNERQQEGSESDHETLERSQEDQRSASGKRKSRLPNRGNSLKLIKCRTPLYGHPFNTGTLLLRTVVPSSYIFSWINQLKIQAPFDMERFCGPLLCHGTWLYCFECLSEGKK